MNVRDPFNLRTNPASAAALHLLRSTASQAQTKALSAGAHALDLGRQAVEDAATMSFSVPKNVPSFANPQRALEDRLWPSSGVSSRSSKLGRAVGGVLGPERGGGGLPMYKDKPYGYRGSQRARPVYRRKRVVGLVVMLVLGLMWWLGGGEKVGDVGKKVGGGSRWEWLKGDETKGKGGKKVDWEGRRERVVEAFELSWDAYSRYAWGELPPRARSVRIWATANCDAWQVMTSSTLLRRPAA